MSKKPNRAKPGDWPAQHRYDYEFARSMILDQGEVAPMFVIHGADRTVVMLARWRTDDDKDRFVMAVRAVAVAEDAQCISFISEAWVRDVAPTPGETRDEAMRRAHQVPPSQAEDRKEIALVITEYRDRAGEICRRGTAGEIVRRYGDGKPSAVSKLDWKADAMEGRFVGLVPPLRPTAEQRESMRAVIEHMGGFVEIGGRA